MNKNHPSGHNWLKRSAGIIVLQVFATIASGCHHTAVELASESQQPPPPPVSAPGEHHVAVGKATADYTRSIDSMEIAASGWLVGNGDAAGSADSVLMTVYYRSPGTQVARPTTARLIIEFTGAKCRYEADPDMTILVNGAPRVTGRCKIMHSECDGPRTDLILRSPEVPFGTLEELVGAKRVVLKIGESAIDLSADAHTAIADAVKIVAR